MKVQPAYVLFSLLFVGLLLVGKFLYETAEETLKDEAIKVDQRQTEQVIRSLIEEQGQASMTLALTLSENPWTAEILSGREKEASRRLSQLVERIHRREAFRDLWVQLIDLKGNSTYRSWTDQVGDNLSQIRPEIQTLLETSQPRQAVSVGKFTVSFKSMMPVKDSQGRLSGVVEVITHFAPLADSLLEERGVGSVILVDRRYQSRLSRADPTRFLDGYYVDNENVSSETKAWIQIQGVSKLAALQGYLKTADFVIARVPVTDSNQKLLAHWLVFTPYKQIQFSQATWVLEKYLYMSVVAVLLFLLLFSLYLRQDQLKKDKRYFRQIIDSVPDIIYLSNNEQIVDANRHFFEFFDEFPDLDAFLSRHRCVCDLFVKEPGYLAPKVNGQFWLDYVLSHPEKRHKAKIVRHGETKVFLVKIKRMKGLNETLYNVLMQDISKIEAYEKKLKHLSVTDELTGAGNRLACNHAMKRELRRAHRYLTPLCLAIYDIDHFKEINDEFGHDVGDRVLVELTRLVQKGLRETDVLCRFGGEEFLVILPQTELEEAKEIADRLRERIESFRFNGMSKGITVSFGIAERTAGDHVQMLLKRADQALYRAKRKGRNRVELAASPETE